MVGAKINHKNNTPPPPHTPLRPSPWRLVLGNSWRREEQKKEEAVKVAYRLRMWKTTGSKRKPLRKEPTGM